MPQVVLKIDALNTDGIFSPTDRRSMLEVSRNLLELSWSYRPGTGGLWDGSASFRLKKDSRAWRQLKRGRHGAAWIYWTPEGSREAADFDATESNRLLWFGTLEDLALDPEAEIAACTLRGAGQILSSALVDLPDVTGGAGGNEYAWQLATSIASLAATQGPFPTKEIAVVGACARRAYIDETFISAAEAMEKVASQIGGGAVIAWGARPAGGADDLAEIYFRPWTSSLWERSASYLAHSWSIAPGQILELEVGRETRELSNSIQVFGSEGEFTFYASQAESAASIARFGRRKKRVLDSRVQTGGQAAALASGLLEEFASPRLNLRVTFEDNLDHGDQGAHPDGAFAGLIQTGIAKGGRPITLMLEDLTPPAVVGVAPYLARIVRQTGTGNLLAFDTSSAGLAQGRFHPNPVCNAATSFATGEGQLHVIQGRFTGANPAGNVNLWELDRKLCVVLARISGDNYQVALVQHQGSGWTTISTGGVNIPWTLGAAGTNLDERWTFGIEFWNAAGSGVDSLKVYRIDANGTRSTVGDWTAALSVANYSGSGTEDWLLVNGAVGTGGAAVANKGWSRDLDLYAFDVYSGVTSVGGPDFEGLDAGELLDTIGTSGSIFAVAKLRILSAQLGIISEGTGPSGLNQCAVRYAYADAGAVQERRWGFDATLITSAAASTFTEDSQYPIYSNDWLLGGGSTKRLLGSGIEILPHSVQCTYQGRQNPLLVELQGDAAATSIVGSIENLRRTLENVQRANDE